MRGPIQLRPHVSANHELINPVTLTTPECDVMKSSDSEAMDWEISFRIGFFQQRPAWRSGSRKYCVNVYGPNRDISFQNFANPFQKSKRHGDLVD